MGDETTDTPPEPLRAASPDGAATSVDSAPPATGKGLLIVFWIWAALLAVITVAQLLGLDGVLDVLDVKRWFTR